MSTMTITSAAQVTPGAGYLQNVGHAARALLAALFSVPQAKAAVAVAPAKAEARKQVSVYRLYRMASQYDSVMPNLAQELRVIAGRDAE